MQTKNKHVSSQHFVDFYSGKDLLFNSLTPYILEGLQNGETCIVIATQEHIKKLREDLAGDKTAKNGRLIALDAEETLASFMIGELPDEKLFQETIGSLMEKVSQSGKPIRAFGEMVALLWKRGNRQAVIELEDLWNRLAKDYSFCLYCAYPELHFIMDPEPKQSILDQHNSLFSSTATA
jgi:hypothetical protein